MTFSLKRTFDLSDYGWNDCSISFQALAYGEIKTIQEKVTQAEPNKLALEEELIGLISAKVVDGYGLDDKGNKLAITKDNFKDLPSNIVVDLCYKLSGGETSPN